MADNADSSKSKRTKQYANKSAASAYLKYSGMGIQMALIIIVFSYLGIKIDEWLRINLLFTVIFSLLGVGLSMFVFIRQILSESKKEEDSEFK